MAALDEAQVRRYAREKLVADVEGFIAAVEAGNLWRFAKRPLDLNWMIDYWRGKTALGTLAQMVEASITARLDETSRAHQRHDGLTTEQCWPALERVGAALVFGRAQTLLLPGGAPAPGEAVESLDLEQVLPDWSPQDVRKLLHRPVFDPATFGRSRLHNDNTGDVRAFLAARWLQSRRRAGCDYPTLRDLLFADVYGHQVIRADLGPVAAWLALWDDDVAREVLHLDPGLFITAGDPGSLSPARRVAVLDAVVSRLSNGPAPKAIYDHDKLKRFTAPDLADAVRRHWEAGADKPAVRQLLLMMISLGRLAACVDLAEEVALDKGATRLDQIFAGRAVAQLGDASAIQRLANHIRDNLAVLPAAVVWDAVENLFPAGLTIDDLLAAIDQAPEADGFNFRRLGPDLVGRVTDTTGLGQVLEGLVRRAERAGEPEAASFPQPKDIFGPSLTIGALRLLQRSPEDEVPEPALDAYFWLARDRGRGGGERRQALRQEFGRTAARRQKVYWTAAERLAPRATRHGQALNAHFQLEYYGWPGGLQRIDLDWLLVDMLTRGEPEERRLALSSALDVWRNDGETPEILARLRVEAGKDPALAAFLEFWLTPHQPDEAHAKLLAEMEANKLSAEKASAKRRQSWERFLDEVRADTRIIADLPPRNDGKAETRLYNLWSLARGMAASDGWAFDDLAPALPLLGEDLAQALRVALSRYWRAWAPTLRSSRAAGKRNLYSDLDAMALTGVNLEAAVTPGWPATLSPAEAERAVELATLSMTQLPEWITPLAMSWPEVVANTLAREIIPELDYGKEDRPAVLYAVARADAAVRAGVAPALATALAALPALDGEKLSDVLRILAAAPQTMTAIMATVRERTSSAPPELAATYLSTLFGAAPQEAVDRLRARLAGLAPEEQTVLSSNFLPRLFGNPLFGGGGSFEVPFPILLDLVKIAYRTIRPEDDVERRSGVAYTRDARDNAQDARHAVLHHLSSIEGQATYETLLRMADGQEIDIDPDWLRELAHRRLVEDSKARPWAAGEARAFENSREIAPRSAAELQDLIARRIVEIDHDLIHGDFHRGRAFKREPDETGVQNWTAGRLRDLQGVSYGVEREPHRVGEKKPDIVARGKRSDASLAIEIKLVDGLSIRDLEHALIEQLCGRYLRADQGRHGMLLLAYQQARPTGWRHPDTSAHMSFGDVVRHLQHLAAAISGEAFEAPQPIIGVLDVSTLPEEGDSAADVAGAGAAT